MGAHGSYLEWEMFVGGNLPFSTTESKKSAVVE